MRGVIGSLMLMLALAVATFGIMLVSVVVFLGDLVERIVQRLWRRR